MEMGTVIIYSFKYYEYELGIYIWAYTNEHFLKHNTAENKLLVKDAYQKQVNPHWKSAYISQWLLAKHGMVILQVF